MAFGSDRTMSLGKFRPKAILFDAYGTLFDIHSLVLHSDLAADLDALAGLWRQKQLEGTWLRSLMGQYADFWVVTNDALRYTLKELNIHANEAQITELAQAYLRPPVYPEIEGTLNHLSQQARLGILSNGTPEMLQSAVEHNALEGFFTDIISADRARTYKPSPKVYALGPATLGCRADEILFVSSNWWDAAGAKAFGFRVCWCNRSAARADFFGNTPDMTVAGLEELARS